MIPQTPFSRDILCSDRGSIVPVTGDCLRTVPSPPRRSSQASWGAESLRNNRQDFDRSTPDSLPRQERM